MDIRIGTFNILDPHYAIAHNEPAGLQHPWPQRAAFMAQFLQQANLDILCLQEISPESLKDLQPAFLAQGYAIEYIKHPAAVNHPRHDGLAILYKTAQFAKKSFHTLSKYKLASCFLDLQNTEGKVIRIANCHLQGGPQGPTQGYEQLQQLQQAVDQQDSSVVARVIVGDFNEDEKNLSQQNSKLSILQNAQYQFDGNLTPTEPSKNRRIDWIWVKSPHAQLTPLPILPSSQPISDHLLTATQIRLPASQPPVSPTPPLSHNQPIGSFREKIIRHFNITVPGWDQAIHNAIKAKLDAILTARKDNKPFLDAVKADFQAYTATLTMTDANRHQLDQDLLSAIAAAQTEQVHNPQLKPLTTPPPPTQATPSAPPARKPSFFSSVLEKIKGLFTRFLAFFRRLFNRSAV